jgi:hypothetical protein
MKREEPVDGDNSVKKTNEELEKEELEFEKLYSTSLIVLRRSSNTSEETLGAPTMQSPPKHFKLKMKIELMNMVRV